MNIPNESTTKQRALSRLRSNRLVKRGLLFACLAIPVQDAHANWREREKIVEGSLSSGDLFGTSAQLSDDSVFISAKGRAADQGEVFVRSLGATGSSSFVSLNLPEGQDHEGSFFGNALVENDGTLFVAAHRKNIPVGTDVPEVQNAGAVHVYKKIGAGNWQWIQTLSASDPGKTDQFGTAIASDGQTLVVSAPRRDSQEVLDSGAVYVYEASSSGQWIQTQIIEAPQPGPGKLFGNRIAIAEGRLLVGAYKEDGQGASEGRVFAYKRSTNSSDWQLTQTIQAPSPAPGARFGYSLDIHGEIAVIGAPGENVNGITSGAVHVFSHSGSNWQAQARVVPAMPLADVEFGSNVDLSPDQRWIGVGAPQDSDKSPFAGAIHMFSKTGSTWSEQQKLFQSSAALFDEFGGVFHLRNNKLVVGVRNDDGAGRQAGAAFLFENEQGEEPAPAPLGSLLSLSLCGAGLVSLRRRRADQ